MESTLAYTSSPRPENLIKGMFWDTFMKHIFTIGWAKQTTMFANIGYSAADLHNY